MVTINEVDAAKSDVFETMFIYRDTVSELNNRINFSAEKKAADMAKKAAVEALNNFTSRAQLAVNELGYLVITEYDIRAIRQAVEEYKNRKQKAFNDYNNDIIKSAGKRKFAEALEQVYNHAVNVRNEFEMLAAGLGYETADGQVKQPQYEVTTTFSLPKYLVAGAVIAFIIFLIFIKKRKK